MRRRSRSGTSGREGGAGPPGRASKAKPGGINPPFQLQPSLEHPFFAEGILPATVGYSAGFSERHDEGGSFRSTMKRGWSLLPRRWTRAGEAEGSTSYANFVKSAVVRLVARRRKQAFILVTSCLSSALERGT
jgi:hypothetical protein